MRGIESIDGLQVGAEIKVAVGARGCHGRARDIAIDQALSRPGPVAPIVVLLIEIARATPRLDALLFGESQGRVVITCAALDATKVAARAKILGVPAAKIGTVGGDALKLKTPAAEFSAPVADLHDLWWNSIARTMK